MASFSGVTSVFVEAAALRSIVLRYAGVPKATRVSFLLLFFFCLIVAFSEYFFWTIPAFSLYGEWVYVLSFRMMVLFYLVTTG